MRPSVSDFPRAVRIEVCNFCNARCIMCPISSMQRKPRIMEMELFEKIVSELEQQRYDGWVYPYLNGEALLVPNFPDYLRLIRSKAPRAKIVLFSNGSKLTERLARILLEGDLLDLLRISFDGGTKEAYESVRRNLSFDEVRKNVHNFIELRNRLGKDIPEVTITMVVSPRNRDTIGALEDEFRDADDVAVHGLTNWAGQWEMGETKQDPTLRHKLMTALTRTNYCNELYRPITILVNGDVPLCCVDYEGKELLGNVRRNTIAEVWHGERYNKTRDALQNWDFSALPLCSRCTNVRVSLITKNPVVQGLKRCVSFYAQKHPRFAAKSDAISKKIYYYRISKRG